MNRCKNCKHWETWPAVQDKSGECVGLKTGTSVDEDMPELNGLIARGYEDPPIILTGPEFGCLHFTAREPREAE